MAQAETSQRKSKFRVGRIIAVVVVLIGLGAAARLFYFYQRDQNTLRLINEANAAYDREDWPAAVKAYAVYVNRDPFNEHALRRYAELLLERGDVTRHSIGEATRALRRLLQIDDDVDAMKKLTGIYFLIDEAELAENMARRWLEAAPDDPDATVALCEVYRRKNRVDDGIALLTSAIERAAGDPVYYPLLIELHLVERGDVESARRWMEKGLDRHPDAPDVQMAAFTFHRAQGDPGRAEAHLEKALSADEKRLPILVVGAGFYVTQGQLDKARALLDRAGRLDATNRRLLLTWGSWALKRGTPEALMDAAARLDEHGDDDGEVLALAAELYVRAGAFDEVDGVLERLQPIARRDEQARAWVEMLRGARTLLSGDAYGAVPHLESALRRKPDHAWTMELLALAYSRVGAVDEAAELYRRLNLRVPGSSAIELSLARLAWQRGQPEAAIDHVRAIGASATPEQQRIAELIETVSLIVAGGANIDDAAAQARLEQQLSEAERFAADDAFTVELLTSGYVGLKRQEAAVSFVRERCEDAEADPGVLAEVGHVLASAGEWASARAIADLLSRSPRDAGAGHVLAARCRAHESGAKEALRYVDALDEAPDVIARALAAIGDVMLSKDDCVAALAPLRRAAELLPEDMATRQNIVRCTDDADEAARVIEQLKRIEGEDGLYWRYERAAFLTRTEHDDDALRTALDLVKTCLDARPTWTAALLVRGLAQERLGQLSEAADAYRTAIAQRTSLTQGDIAIRLVGLLKRLGRFAEADSIVATLADWRPGEPRVLRLQTERYLRRRRLASAVATAEELLAVNRSDAAWAAFTADLQLRAGNAARAEAIARAGLEDNERSIALLWSLARALVAQGRAEDAESYLRRSADRLEDARHFLVLAQLLTRLGRQEEAAGAVRRALSLAPEDTVITAAASDFWASAGDRAKQLEYARKTIELRGEDPAESITLAALLADGGSVEDLAEARAIVDRRLASNDKDVDALILSAKLATMAAPPDLDRAETQLESALDADPRSEPGHKLLATVQARRGRLNDARNTVEAGLSYAPDDPDLLRTAGELHMHRGEFAAAVAPLRRLLELGAQTPETVGLLVSAYRETGRIDRALDLLRRRIEEDRATPREYVALAELYETTMNYEQAEATFAEALERDGASGRALQKYVNYLARREAFARVYALAQQRQSRYPDDMASIAVAAEVLASRAEDPELRATGRAWLDEIIEQHPGHAADAAFRAGMTHYRRQQYAQAERYFTEAARRAPRSPRPVNALAWLHVHHRRNPVEALAIVERFLDQGGQASAELLDTHAAILVRLKRYDEAAALLTRCLALAGQSPTLTAAHYRMGLVLHGQGRTEECAEHLRKALLLNDRLSGLLPEESRHAEKLLAR